MPLCFLTEGLTMRPPGFEPGSQASEAYTLSIVLWAREARGFLRAARDGIVIRMNLVLQARVFRAFLESWASFLFERQLRGFLSLRDPPRGMGHPTYAPIVSGVTSSF